MQRPHSICSEGWVPSIGGFEKRWHLETEFMEMVLFQHRARRVFQLVCLSRPLQVGSIALPRKQQLVDELLQSHVAMQRLHMCRGAHMISMQQTDCMEVERLMGGDFVDACPLGTPPLR